MPFNVSLDEEIDDSGLIISVSQRTSSQELIISYRWPVLFLIFFAISGITGNLLVCLAIGTERRLQTRTNWFLFSLALADMLISGLVIPLAIVKDLTGEQKEMMDRQLRTRMYLLGFWRLGTILCDFWLFVDVCSCTSSIMHIVVISIDRYLAITDPLNDRTRQENYQIRLLIISIWLIAILLSSPMIVLALINPHNILINDRCLINNQFFVIYGSVISFVIPLIIVIVMYALTVYRLKKQIKQCQTQFAQEQITTTVNPVVEPVLVRQTTSNQTLDLTSQSTSNAPKDIRRHQRLQRQQTSVDLSEETSNQIHSVKPVITHDFERQKSMKVSPHAEYACPKNPFCQLKCTCHLHHQKQQVEPVPEEKTPRSNCLHCCQVSLVPQARPISIISHQSSSSIPMHPLRRHWRRLTLIPSLGTTRPKSSSVRNEQKAVRVLGVIFTIFVIAWFPFCILNILQAVCKRCAINENVLNGFVWLGYVSSSINPVVYTIFNRNFRLKFITLLKCQCLYETNRQKQLSYYRTYSSLHGSRVRRTNGLVQNDIRRFNARRQIGETQMI